MVSRSTVAVGVAAGCAVVVGLLARPGTWPSAPRRALGQQWARRPSAGAVAGTARGAFRQAVLEVSATRGAPDEAAVGTPATSGGVIPLETVPIDQLSDWELDLLTTPDP